METLQTRTEHSRSIEDADMYRAIQTLTELGTLVPVGDTAFDAAQARFADLGNHPGGYQPEAADLTSSDSDATVINLNFDSRSLDEASSTRYEQALSTLLLPLTEGSPVSFGARESVRPFAAAVQELGQSFVRDEQIAALASQAGVEESTALQLAGAYNARLMLSQNPAYLSARLLDQPTDMYVDTIQVDNASEQVPVNLEYVQRYMREAHIIGVMQQGDTGATVTYFDTDRTVRVPEQAEQQKTMQQTFGGIVSVIEERPGRPSGVQETILLKRLGDPHAKPASLIDAARQVEGYADIFDTDVRNWEGLTLAMHTETVLRNFDENFADKLPVALLEPMRLAIIGHDIGKPIADAHKERHKQKVYNAAQAADFYDKLGVDDGMKALLLTVIGEGSELAYKIDIRHAGADAEEAMRLLAIDTLQQMSGTDAVDESQVEGFTQMCKILQICDGGAYTSMATTRVGADEQYRNIALFNGSFAPPVGLGKRNIRLRRAGETYAPANLTPVTPEEKPDDGDYV